MNRNKKLLILFIYGKRFPSLPMNSKKVFHAFSFQLYSTANFKFSFNVSLCEIKGRIHSEIFLSEHFMKYNFRLIS